MILRHATLLLPLILLLPLPAAAETIDHAWSRGFGDASWQDPGDVAVDAHGNIYLLGSNNGVVDYGGGGLPSTGLSDLVVAKLDPDGRHLWSRDIPGTGDDIAASLAVTPDGDVVVCGTFDGSIDFGGGPMAGTGGRDICLARLDGDTGAHVWSRSFRGSGLDAVNDLAVDRWGGVFVCGEFDATLDLGGGPLTSAGGNDLYVAAFGAGGDHVWSFARGDAGHQYARGLAVRPDGRLFVTGDFEGTVDFGGGPFVSSGATDVFLVCCDAADGAYVHGSAHGDAAIDDGRALAVQADGGVVLSGFFLGSIFNGAFRLTSTTLSDVYIAAFDADGSLLATRCLGGNGAQTVTGLAVDGAGNVLVCGAFYTEIDLGDGPIPSLGVSDIFLAKYGAALDHVWGEAFGGTWYQYSGDVAVDGARDVILFAGTEQPLDLGGGVLPYGGGTDQVLAKYAVDPAADAGEAPAALRLLGASPNPFNPGTTIRFELSAERAVDLTIYDASGGVVREILSGTVCGAGRHGAAWDGRDRRGRNLATGVYFYRVSAGVDRIIGRMALLR